MTWIARALLLACCLAASQGYAATSVDAASIDVLLQQAEALRSSRPDEFRAILGQLNASLRNASPTIG